MWLFFLVLHLVGLTGFNLLARKSLLAKNDPLTVATIMQTGIAIPTILALLFHPINFSAYSPEAFLFLTMTVAFTISLQITNAKSLQYLEASVFSVLYNLRILFASMLGITFLGEAILPLQLLGGLLIFLAIVMVRQKGSHSTTLRGIGWGILAAIVISVLNLFEKLALNEVSFFEFAIPAYIISAAIMWILLLIRQGKPKLKTFATTNALGLMGFRAISAYGFTLALAFGGKLSVTNYISSLSVILIVVLGVVWLGERDYLRQKVLATVLAVAGLTFILLAQV